MHNAIFFSLQTVWAARGISSGKGTTPGRIVAFERANGLIFSDVFREYLKRFNGTKEKPGGDNLLSFYSLAQISEGSAKNIINLETGSTLVVFAGCAEKSVHYAIQCTRRRVQDSGVFLVTKDDDERYFESFVEFLQSYMKHEQDLMEPDLKVDNQTSTNRSGR